MKEVGRLILADVNFDGHTDLLVCLGRYDAAEHLQFDAWIWEPGEEFFVYDEDFRYYKNPAISASKKTIFTKR